jgi:hypothetical protein
MDVEFLKNVSAAIQSLVTSMALVVGGAWAYTKFRYRREKDPRAECDVELNFVGLQDGRVLVEVSAYVENKGSVRHPVQDFTITLRYLLDSDPVVDGSEQVKFQPNFPHAIKRELWKETYIDPGLRYRNSYIAALPADATFVLVFGRFYYGNEKFTVQRLFKVPKECVPVLLKKDG